MMSWIALGLQALLGEAQLTPNNGASSHAQKRLLGSPSTPMISDTWRPTLSPCATSPRSLCSVMWHKAWCLLTSLAQQRGLSSPQLLLCHPPEGMWGGWWQQAAVSLRCLFSYRRAGRMAWNSLVLLPFLLVTGEDFARQLARVDGRLWRLPAPRIHSEFPEDS